MAGGPGGVQNLTLDSTMNKLTSTVERTRAKAATMAERTSQTVISLLSTLMTFVLIVLTALFLYATFYYSYMPQDIYKLPVHLEFEPCNSTVEKCSNPIGTVRLGKGEPLVQGQTYSMSLMLEVPDTQANEDHGMFMSCLSIASSSGVMIERSCKSSMLAYRSGLLRVMETLFFAPSLLLGFSAQKQELQVDYFSQFETNPHTPGEVLTVEIQSRHIQVKDATMEIVAELRGLRYIMHRHPWISAFVGVGSNLAMLVTIILVSWTRFLTGDSNTRATTRGEETVESEQDEETENATAASGEENSTEDVPAEIPVRAPRGIIRSLFRFLVMSSIKLLLLVTIGLVSFNAYQHETYEPGKLYEITLEQVTEFITSEKRSEDIDTLKTLIMNSYTAVVAWDDIFVKLFVAKIIFVVLLIVIMTSTRYIV